MFQFRRVGLCVALGAFLALVGLSLPLGDAIFAPGAVHAAETSIGDYPVSAATDNASVGIEGTPDVGFPVAVTTDLESIDELPGTGARDSAGGPDWTAIAIVLAVASFLACVAFIGLVYGNDRARRDRDAR